MARRVRIDVIGDAASYAAAVRKGIAATGDLEVALVDLQTAATKSTEVQIAASLKREARLRTEARTARAFAAQQAPGSMAQHQANQVAMAKEAQLQRLLGVSAVSSAESIHASAQQNLRDSMAVRQAKLAEAEVYKKASLDETLSLEERAAASSMAVKAENEAARAVGMSAAASRRAASEAVAAEKAKAAASKDAVTLARERAAATLQAGQEEIASLELQIKEFEKLAAAATLGSNEQIIMTKAAGDAQVRLDKILSTGANVAAAGNKKVAMTAQERAQAQVAATVQEMRAIEADITAYKAQEEAAITSDQRIAASRNRRLSETKLASIKASAGVVAPAAVIPPSTRVAEAVQGSTARRAALMEEIVILRQMETTEISGSEKAISIRKQLADTEKQLASAYGITATEQKAVMAQLEKMTGEQLAQSMVRKAAAEQEVITQKAIIATSTEGSAAFVAAREKMALAQSALNAEEEKFITLTEFQATKQVVASKQFNTGIRGVLAGSGVFKILGRSLAFASSGFLAFSLGAFAIRKAVDSAVELQKQMEYLHTQANATTGEVTKMTTAVERLAPALGTNPDELAKGLYHIESAGLRGKNAINALTVAAKGAVIGGSDLEDTATALIATWKSGVSGVTSFATAMSAANAIVGAGNMRMQDLVKSLSTPLLATAKTAGLSIDGVGAALDVLTVKWGPNSNAATRLAMAINLLSAPTAQAQRQLKGIGITETELGDTMRNHGLAAALTILKQRMQEAGMTATEQGILLTRAFGGGRSSGAVKVLIQSIDELQKKQHQIAAQIGTLDEKWAATVKTAEFASKRWKASIAAIETELGANLLPTLTKTANGFANWMSKEKNQTAIQNDFTDAIKITGFALKTTWASAEPFIKGFQQMSQIVGGANRALEILVSGMVAFRLHSKFFAGFKFAEIVTGFRTIAATVAIAGLRMATLTTTVGLLGSMIMKNARGLGLIAMIGGTQIHNLPGLNNSAGRGIGDVVSNTGAGLFAGSFVGGRRGAIVGAGLGLGRGLNKAIGGTAGDFTGNILGGATAGLAFGPEGALAGAAIGLTKSFIDLAMSGQSAAEELKKIGDARNKAQFAATRAQTGVLQARDRVSSDRVQRDTQASYLAESRATEIATRGTRQHRAAVDQLRYAQREYAASVRQLKADLGSLGSAMVNQVKTSKDLTAKTADEVKKFQDLANASQDLKKLGGAYSNLAQAQTTSAEKLQDYVKKMNALGKSLESSDPKMAAVAHQLANIAIQLGLIPSKKTIDIYVRTHQFDIPGKGTSTPHPGQQGRADIFPGTGSPMIPSKAPGKVAVPIRTFTLPTRFAIQEAKAITDAQEVTAAKARLAYATRLIAQGNLIGQAYIDALNEKKSDIQAIQSFAKRAAGKGKSTSVSKLVDPKVRDRVARAFSDFASSASADTASAYIAALKAEREWITNRIKRGHLTGNQRVALDKEIGSINTKIAAVGKKTFDSWAIPLKLQLEAAKAAATVNIDADDLNVAGKIKKAAMAAIKSGKLGINAQISAWNAVEQANQQLLQGTKNSIDTFHSVSTRILTRGLDLPIDKLKILQERLAQSAAHAGMAPNGPAALGFGVDPNKIDKNYGKLSRSLASVADKLKPLYALNNHPGLIKRGNIDLNHRKIVHNKDGSISTEESVSIGTNLGEVLIPTVFNAAHHTVKQAIAHFYKTGQNLGVFKSIKTANAYAVALHNRQAQFYGAGGTAVTPLMFSGVGGSGNIIITGDVSLNGVQSDSELYRKLEHHSRTKKKSQRRGVRK